MFLGIVEYSGLLSNRQFFQSPCHHLMVCIVGTCATMTFKCDSTHNMYNNPNTLMLNVVLTLADKTSHL